MRVLAFLLLLLFINPVYAAEEVYICPMHPHIEGGAGDTCPICGMSLVPKQTEKTSASGDESGTIDENAIVITPEYIQALGVKTAQVSLEEFGKSIRAYGKIAASTRLEHTVTVREDGWIVDLATSAIGDNVKKGDLLFTFYSPDLMSAQSDYLIGSRTGKAEQRLRLYGMDDKAIAEFKKGGKMMEATPFYAPLDGTVTMLEARPGMYMGEGARVLTLQDFSKVWINAEVPLRDIEFLKAGDRADIALSETGKKIQGTIDFIHPIANPDSRTVTVRVVADNPDGALKPETYANVTLTGKLEKRLAVPQDAILYGEGGSYVIEALGDGKFRPRMVETGITANGLTEITSGLEAEERIVSSGQFMIDAESNLRGGMANMGHDHGDMVMPEMGSDADEGSSPAMNMEGGHVH